MEQIYVNALNILTMRITQCGYAVSKSYDAGSIQYWIEQLDRAKMKHSLILKRSKLAQNVVFVDFINKKRVA